MAGRIRVRHPNFKAIQIAKAARKKLGGREAPKSKAQKARELQGARDTR